MIKEISIKRIIKMSLLLIVLGLFYIFPNNNNNNYKTKYVSSTSNYHDIFLIDKNNYVAKTTISVSSIDKEKMALDLIKSLTIDSENKNKIPESFQAIIPKKTKVNKVRIENESISINFSNKIMNSENKEKMIECIVYTLTSINGINKVYLSTEEENDYFKEVYDRSIGINKNINIFNFQDIQTINLYYISTTNNVNYYVPVTKYINSKDNKINIIIEELASRSSYESNLISYLNYDTKLINYNIENNDMYLFFNDAILTNDNDNNILEEVKYCISYSIKDSFDIDNVHFLVNDKEF